MSEQESIHTTDKSFLLTNVAQLQRWLPWLRLFRGFRIAVDYQKIIVSLAAIMLWLLGNDLITSQFSSEANNTPPSSSTMFASSPEIFPLRSFTESSPSPATLRSPFSKRPFQPLSITWPFERITTHFGELAGVLNGRSWWEAWFQLAWGFAVCALLGGTVARMSAREVTGHSRALIRDFQFAWKQLPSTFLAPVVSLAGFVALWSNNWLAGFVGRVPVIGELLLGLFWFVILFTSLMMALIVLGLILGWPLMFCASNVERNDSFDSLSRSLSYLLNRPWYSLFLALIAYLYGSILLAFVQMMTHLTFTLGVTSVAAGLGKDAEFNGMEPVSAFIQNSKPLFEHAWSNSMINFWMSWASLIPAAFAFSFFWTSVTIIYFLLRRREDGTPLHEIDLSDNTEEGPPSLAVVGIPAAEMRERQQHDDGE